MKTIEIEIEDRAELSHERDWEAIAKRIARTAKGRSKNRSAVVFVEMPQHSVSLSEEGKFSIRREPKGCTDM